jgi:hypothetical protein
LRIDQLERSLDEERTVRTHANRHVCHDKPALRRHVDWKDRSLADLPRSLNPL